jgi:glycyl-tRNA synthetase beta chain
VQLDTHSKTTTEEKRGPKVGAPEQALNGFLKSTGLTQDQLEIRQTPKGDFYFATTQHQGKQTTDILATLIPKIIHNFPWPKSMRWGSGSLKWVRPLHHILCVFDSHTVSFNVDTIESGNFTFGHRFLTPEKITVTNFADYQAKLTNAFVILDQAERKQTILNAIDTLLKTQNLTLIEDQGLLSEVTGLVEYPVALMGVIKAEFQNLPPELLTLTMKTHQKYFSVQSNETGKITHFITISNMKTADNGAVILNGNQRVLAARLEDAQFFYAQDLKKPLLEHGKKLKNVTYHAKLGSQIDRISRMSIIAEILATTIYPHIPLDDVKQAVLLAKCDLTTEIVGEFPELQGIMGKYYALAQNEKPDIADAIANHYLPKGATDTVPEKPLAIIVALADRIDQLCGFWTINEKPTGSKDPFALRRAALGIIRILHHHNIDLNLLPIIGNASNIYTPYGNIDIIEDLFTFFHDRIKVYLKDFNLRHDYISAVLFGDNFTQIMNNAKTLSNFMDTPIGVDLLGNYKRASNIVKAEEKKDKAIYETLIPASDLTTDHEKTLSDQLGNIVEFCLNNHNFQHKLDKLTTLNPLITTFFDSLIVNDDNPTIRLQRLNVLGAFRELCNSVCEFSKIEGTL